MAIVHLGSVGVAHRLSPENIVNRLDTLRAEAAAAKQHNNPAAALAVLYRKVALDSHIKSWQQEVGGLTSVNIEWLNTALGAFAGAYATMQETIPVVNDVQMPTDDNDLNQKLVALYSTNFVGYTSITPPTPESSPKGSPVRVGKPDDFRGWDNTQSPYYAGLVPNPSGQNSAPTYTLHPLGERYNPFIDELALPVLTPPVSPEGSPQGFPDELFA